MNRSAGFGVRASVKEAAISDCKSPQRSRPEDADALSLAQRVDNVVNAEKGHET
jgi:hypothetical protein